MLRKICQILNTPQTMTHLFVIFKKCTMIATESRSVLASGWDWEQGWLESEHFGTMEIF
jgi:hypothetical protein